MTTALQPVIRICFMMSNIIFTEEKYSQPCTHGNFLLERRVDNLNYWVHFRMKSEKFC